MCVPRELLNNSLLMSSVTALTEGDVGSEVGGIPECLFLCLEEWLQHNDRCNLYLEDSTHSVLGRTHAPGNALNHASLRFPKSRTFAFSPLVLGCCQEKMLKKIKNKKKLKKKKERKC